MNLRPVTPNRGLRLRCCACETWTTDHDTFYDREGIPFTDFYCGPCARILANHHMNGEYQHHLGLAYEEPHEHPQPQAQA